MPSIISSVIIASASATAKVFVIGGIGYYAACRPKASPILPNIAMTGISKMNFNLLVLPLIYSTIASSVTPQKLGSLWFILVSALVVISSSYGVATLLGKLPFFKVENKIDFDALRIAAAFPNILALPILIFPTLCEFAVVHDAFYIGGSEEPTEVEKYKSCVDQANAQIFVYFFGWNFLFWVIGYSSLVEAGSKRQMSRIESHATIPDVHLDDSFDAEQEVHDNASDAGNNTIRNIEPSNSETQEDSEKLSCIRLFGIALFKTLSSPGFVAMVLGFITACIPPLRDALFEPGGALRFFGSAMESLAAASSSVGTIVVAASLVHQSNDDDIADGHIEESSDLVPVCSDAAHRGIESTRHRISINECTAANEEQQTRADRGEGFNRRSSLSQLGSMVRRRSSLALLAIRRRKPTLRMHAWFITSRLIFAPALICALVVAMDCGGILSGIPDLAKMVVIVNAGLPGAQLVVITLKSKGLTDSASIVAKVYLPSYLLSAVTIAAWTSIGLLLSIPDENGASFCGR
ncbi:hypothetical protein ACHAWO_002369 [Cyclotella atomus]|jgi:hypothetical protein|uniref:Auxin efflux carrier n=1 Tax=Cyclotella atomus TaxID=382360 RepID=A0ABD3PYV2_9STRA